MKDEKEAVDVGSIYKIGEQGNALRVTLKSRGGQLYKLKRGALPTNLKK